MGLGDFSVALKPTGEVWAWGYNLYGQLGNQTRTNASSPVLVVGGHSFIEVAGGYYHTLARKANGEVWAWGYNVSGQLGNLTTTSYSSPVLVVGSHVFQTLSNKSWLDDLSLVWGPGWFGACWGESAPTDGEEAVSWQVCQITNPVRTVPTQGDTAWGKAIVWESNPVFSSVVDSNDASEKGFTVTANKYGTGDAVTLYIRGSLSLFAMHDVSPDWELYAGPVNQTWRYVQVKAEY